MPIDASIYNNVQPTPSPLQTLGAISQLKSQQQNQQLGALELQEKQRSMAAETALNNAMSTALDASGNIDESKLGRSLVGTPAAAKWPEIQQHLAGLREAKQKMASAEADHVGSLAAAADAAGPDPQAKAGVLLTGIASGIHDGSIPREHGQQIIQSLLGPDGNPDSEATTRTIATMRAASQEQSKLQNAVTVANIRAKKGLELKPGVVDGQQVQGVFDPNSGATNVAGQDVSGKFQPPSAVITPEQQAQLARQSAANAEAARHNRVDEGLSGARLGLERERMKTGADAPDVGVQADVRTTATGRQYVDLSKYKGKDYSAAQQQAHALGVYGANAGESDALQNIDTARKNFAEIAKSVSKLPSSSLSRGPSLPLVGAVGPGALENRLSAWAQTDPDLSAWGTYRSAAIQALRAMAGAKGLRINRAEIEASMENDIPDITDTQGTARTKLARVAKMLANQESGLMGTAGQSSAPTAPATKANPFRK